MNTTSTTNAFNRSAAGEVETFAMENCLKLLKSHHQNAVVSSIGGGGSSEEEVGRKFACKTCGRKFSSFQALGGHRASHKKIKSPNSGEVSDEANIPAKSKSHACKICGSEFPIGQALGGHMRRHRELLEGHTSHNDVDVDVYEKKPLTAMTAVSGVTTEGSVGHSDGSDGGSGEKKRKIEDVVSEVPILKKSSSSKRVCLDLSLWWKNEQLEEYAAATEGKTDDNKIGNDVDGDYEVEEGEIVEQHEEEGKDLLKLELKLPHQ